MQTVTYIISVCMCLFYSRHVRMYVNVRAIKEEEAANNKKNNIETSLCACFFCRCCYCSFCCCCLVLSGQLAVSI